MSGNKKKCDENLTFSILVILVPIVFGAIGIFLGVNALHSYDDAIAKINTEESIFTDEEEDVIATIINLEADDRELGNYGRIFIPSQNYSAKLNNATYDIPSDNTKLFQEWVDADDCAATYMYGAQRIIADHSNQGFDCIRNLHKGDKIYIVRETDETLVYECTDELTGYNNGQLFTDDGKSLREMNLDGISLYTCASSTDSYHIVIRVFQRYNKLDY